MAGDRQIKQEKQRLRDQIRQELAAVTPTEREQHSRRIRKRIEAELDRAKVVAAFASTKFEPDLDPLWSEAFFSKCLLLFPRVEGQELALCPISSLQQLQTGKFGIREPSTPPTDLRPDAILVPGLAFSPTGYRLGRGAGYYDRLLQRLTESTHKLGICFPFQLLNAVPFEPHDQRVDQVVSG
jgi:5-formyltetrahydrofolate cyclo-ligase